ncbi:aminopeptidase P family protein [Treponema sp. HNW]|uniref:aminopeptidase P family protein n=1 Tax=Treponema sp. HNW TaxID=3116654 RepID=UPI003D0F796A
MNIPERIAALRQKMKECEFDAYIIPSSDPHQNEYLPAPYKTREFMSGFTGSAGTLLVTADKAGLWTDGRYFLQAEYQLKGSGITLFKMEEPGIPTLNAFLKSEFKAGAKIGMDGKVVSLQNYEAMQKELEGMELVTGRDLVGDVWKDRPEPVLSEAFILGNEYAGKSASQKIAEVRAGLAEKGADATLIGSCEDVCYLFNIRGNDIPCNPVLISYALIDKTRAVLFINEKQINGQVRSFLEKEGVTVAPYEAAFSEAEKLKGTVYIDSARTNVYVRSKIKARIVQGLNISSVMKASKNETELRNFDIAMEKDGAAMVKILKWIEDNVSAYAAGTANNPGISEYDVSTKLLEFRAEGKDFIEASFETISAYGPNAAIVHYAPAEQGSALLEPKGFLLLDSGGHYINGTTDITRTVPLGPLTAQEKESYTLVLQSHIRLALAQFKAGAAGLSLDTIARLPLWERGMDYNHGTGHGVGYLLPVHEGPQSISKRPINEALKLGMVTSNEPGYYAAGKYGIRIENLIVTVPAEKTRSGEFYRFKTITLCPIDTGPLVPGILSQKEIDWLNAYHEEVRTRLSPYLDEEHRLFLEEKTKKL